MENVVYHIKGIGNRWKELGEKLLSKALMNQIHNLMLSDDEGIVAVIHAWLHDDGKDWEDNYISHTTWRHLLQLLEEMGETNVADEVKDFAEPREGDDNIL